VQDLTLVPLGAARLRISAFPVISSDPSVHKWTAPVLPRPAAYKTSASHVFASDSLDALCDDLVPKNSNDHEIPRFTWWSHRGTKEWVQYNFPAAKKLSSASVYWFDDTGAGQCRVPASWRLVYLDGGAWKPVPASGGFGVKADTWNEVQFAPVLTSALRLEVDLQPGFSGGILEWRVK
jgi:hypothetical protein